MAVEILSRIAVLVVMLFAILSAIEHARNEGGIEPVLRGFVLGAICAAGAILAVLALAAGGYYVLTGRWVGA